MTGDGNQRTLDAYEAGAEAYLRGTPDRWLEGNGGWASQALARKPPGPVLEIGSGTGHDAARIEAEGFEVKRTDATLAFVRHLRTLGHDASSLNVLTDEIPGRWPMIYSFAVMQHFLPGELAHVLGNCARALAPGGVLAFATRRGNGTQWVEGKGMEPRRFTFWQPGPLWAATERAGLRVISVAQSAQTALDADLITKRWLLVTAVKDASD